MFESDHDEEPCLLKHDEGRLLIDLCGHLLKYEWNFAGGGGQSLLWLEATTFLNYIDIYLSDHLLNYGWNFAGGGGNSLLWPEATAFLNHLGTYSRPEARGHIVLFSHKSLLPPGQMVTTLLHGDKRRTLLITTKGWKWRHGLPLQERWTIEIIGIVQQLQVYKA